jgi:hypothetical protein
MVAVAVLLLLQVPPPVASVSVVVRPTQTLFEPTIPTGCGLTNIDLVAVQPAGSVYIILVDPAVTPVTTPVPATTDAVPGAALLQVPPVTALANVVARPAQTLLAPVIAGGVGLTTNGAETAQPVGNVNVMFREPAAIPVTIPVAAPTVAKVGLLLLQVETPETSVSVVVPPTHTLVVPPIAAGKGLTRIPIVALQPEGIVYIMLGEPAATPDTIPVVAPTVA